MKIRWVMFLLLAMLLTLASSDTSIDESALCTAVAATRESMDEAEKDEPMDPTPPAARQEVVEDPTPPLQTKPPKRVGRFG